MAKRSSSLLEWALLVGIVSVAAMFLMKWLGHEFSTAIANLLRR